MTGFTFWLGTHEPIWLRHAGVPLFLSHRRLARLARLYPADVPWALDSGGFTELSMHGEWKTTPHTYAAATRRYHDEIGHLAWAAPQDWMCEPFILAKTGRTIVDHQALTIRSVLDLRTLWPDGPFIPVLQGWERDSYLRHVDAYEAAGFDLETEPIVGLGSVCRRQATGAAEQIVWSLQPLRLHGFGMKTTGLRRYGAGLASSDSMAWSYEARRRPPLPGHTHKSCANCIDYAHAWRDRALAPAPRPQLFAAYDPEGHQ